jgi:molybdate transport system regulatory protein
MMAKVYKIQARKTAYGQRRKTGYQVNGRIWIEKDGELYVGWGRVILLERIKEFGTIAAAARSMKLAYRNAWLWIDDMNRLASVPLVEKVVGGSKGGHAIVTEEGQKAISQYKELREKFLEFIKQQNEVI